MTADASRLSALFVAYRLPVCALLSPGQPGASTPRLGNLILTRVLSTAGHNYGNVSTGEASRLAALLVGQMLPAFFLRAPGDPGASPPDYVTVVMTGST